MRLYLLDYGAGNVQSLANSLTKLGYSFQWIASPSDFDNATVSLLLPETCYLMLAASISSSPA